ncbi:type VI secretion system tip protein VgrG [Algoriphagus formosus]|uniref:type VI secretion system tip protein VgrG n=1 Tax=Algoriphagus formosus TaxID=2007308 RepID=UPI000C289E3C|nr:type VI secretion system tip protein VgrG [Algoriphagus formosus]
MAELLTENDLPISIEIKIDGSSLPATVEIIGVSIVWEINRIAQATLKISDGGAFGLENDPFTNSESENFVPGKAIEIDLGYGDERSLSFKGIITGQRLVVRGETSYLSVTCKNKAFKLTKSRANQVMETSKDSDLFSQLISNAGLTADVSSGQQYSYPLFQYNSSDWDYLVIRAEANNAFVLTDQDKVSVKEFDFSGSADYSIQADMIVIDADLDLSGENTFPDITLSSWDPKTQAVVSVTTSLSDNLEVSNLTANKLAENTSNPGINKFTSAPVSQEELMSFSKSWVSKAILSKVQGKITILGTNKLKPGDLVELKNFNSRFNGTAFISKIEHDCSEGDWKTRVFVGVNPRWHASLPGVQEEDGMGLLPGVKGTHLATVKKINEDPDNEYRVQVELSSFQADSGSNMLWARLAFNYASNQAGIFFFPEVGDEVVLTFLNGDPRFPIIIGSLYSSKNKPKIEPDADNTQKAIHSKSGIEILFNDQDKVLTIKTPAENTFILDDEGKSITLKDCNNNECIMDNTGIKLSSAKDITLNAEGKIDIKAVTGINLEASGGDIKGKGMNVDLEADVSMKAAGNASAEFSASGTTTVKGAMVMIN